MHTINTKKLAYRYIKNSIIDYNNLSEIKND